MDDNKQNRIFEDYPAGIVLLANALTFGIYVLGGSILSQLGLWALLLYIGLCLFQEIRVLSVSCVDCHYYGRLCFSGRGKVSAWFFKRGKQERFPKRNISWWSLVPDMLVTLGPLAVGVFLMVRDFQWGMLAMVLGLAVLAFPGNGFVRGTQACCHCKQRELGCPAEQLFAGKKG